MASRQIIRNVDALTGELVDGTLVMVPAKRRNGFVEGWCAVGDSAFVDVSRLELPGQALRVLMAIIGTIGWGNQVVATQVALAQTMGLLPQNVNRAFRQLVDAGLLREMDVDNGPNLPPTRAFFLNPHLAWKGEAKAHRQALNEWDAATPVGGGDAVA